MTDERERVGIELDAEVVEMLRLLRRKYERAGAKIDALLERSPEARLLIYLQRIETRAREDIGTWTTHLGNHAEGQAPDTRGAVARQREKRRRKAAKKR